MEQPEDILDEAKRITSKERNNSYGPPDQDFSRSAEIWSGILRDKLRPNVSLTNKDVALCMIGLKVSRMTWQDTRDSAVDVAGYARCWAVCAGIQTL